MGESDKHKNVKYKIGEIGYFEGFKFGIEFKINTNYRLDSVWIDVKSGSVTHAFEINFKGNVEKDMIALKIAFEQFNCICVLISSPEILVKAKSILLNTFPTLNHNFKFISYDEILELYKVSKNHRNVKSRLGLDSII